MPVKRDDNLCYSTDELVETLISIGGPLDTDEVVAFATIQGFRYDETDRLWQLGLDDIAALSARFTPCDTLYVLPDSVRECTSPWATTLAGLYRNPISLPSSLSPEQGQLLKDLICNTDPRAIMEIGCFIGISTIWMASGLEQIRSQAIIHSVDLFEEVHPLPPYHFRYILDRLDAAQQAVDSAQLTDRVRFHKMASRQMALSLRDILSAPIELLFIDGDHSKRGCLSDFLLFLPYVAVGGYIVLHDIYPENCGHDGPRWVIDHFVKGSRAFELIEIKTQPNNYGMAIIRKRGHDLRLRVGSAVLRRFAANWPMIKSTSGGHFMSNVAEKFFRA